MVERRGPTSPALRAPFAMHFSFRPSALLASIVANFSNMGSTEQAQWFCGLWLICFVMAVGLATGIATAIS